jgi:hypothetical protein
VTYKPNLHPIIIRVTSNVPKVTRMADIRLLELLGLTVDSNSWKGMATRPRAALGHGLVALEESVGFAR